MEGLRWRFHAKRLVGSAVVVEVDPISNRSGCVLKAFEALPVDALLFQGSNDPLDHAVLLRAVRRYELLLEAVTSDELSECEAGKNQTVVGPQKERAFDLSERSVPRNESLLKSGPRRCGLA